MYIYYVYLHNLLGEYRVKGILFQILFTELERCCS